MIRKKYFYTHIIDTSSLSLELGNMNLTPAERMHLISLIDSNVHHEVLDLVLSELEPDDKKTFLSHLASENHDKIWELLNDNVENIEDKIKKTAEDLKKELQEDIKNAKAKNNEA
ncbi:MAG: hypothetical protein Q7R51_00290 [bacterium]|nr:hypothetical protein [bacterium]